MYRFGLRSCDCRQSAARVGDAVSELDTESGAGSFLPPEWRVVNRLFEVSPYRVDALHQQPIMEDPPSFLVDSDPPDRAPTPPSFPKSQ